MEFSGITPEDLDIQLDLTCGCKLPKIAVYSMMGYQVLTSMEVKCLFHGVPHQFSSDSYAQASALSMVAAALDFTGPVTVEICGRPYTLRLYPIGNGNYSTLITPNVDPPHV